LRYFVRSYVTKPTTIKAMTEIPANTPNPMGKTWIFCPGTEKADADDDAWFSAAAVPPCGAFAAAAASVVVAAGGAVAAGTLTVETAFAETAAPPPDPAVADEPEESVAVDAPESVEEDTATVDTPLALTLLSPLEEDEPDESVEVDESAVEVVVELSEDPDEPLLPLALLIVTVHVLTS